MDLLLFVLAVVAIFFSLKAKSARGKLAGGLVQLAFAILFYIFAKDILGASIHDVAPGKTAEFLFMYFLSLAAIVVYGILGLGNLFIGIMSYASLEKHRHATG